MRFDEHFFKGALSSVSIEGKALPNDIRFLADSKKIQPGDFFIVLAEHDKKCIDEAIARGAKGFFIADKQKEVKKQLLKQGVTVVAVPDTRVALLKLATAWRSQFTCPVIGITGSVGKTSTKEILANILCIEEVSYFSSDNDARNEIDMASNVLRMRSDHKVALFEMGVSRRGQMAELAAIVRPTYAVITNVGHSNMEGLGSLADIALEQRDIFKFFTQESIGVINGDLPVLGSIGYVHPVIKFGSKTANQVQARKINVDDTCINFVLKMYKQKYHIELKNTHSGEVFNSLAAASIAYLLKIPTEIIVKGIQVPIVISGRFERRIMTAGKGVLINDASNANPESMKASLLAFGQIESPAKKVAVLGDMRGLGVNSPFWHRQLGRFLRKIPSLKHVILVGDMVQWTRKTLPLRITAEVVPTWNDAAKRLDDLLKDESLVLVKGSTETKLQNLVEHFAPSEKSL